MTTTQVSRLQIIAGELDRGIMLHIEEYNALVGRQTKTPRSAQSIRDARYIVSTPIDREKETAMNEIPTRPVYRFQLETNVAIANRQYLRDANMFGDLERAWARLAQFDNENNHA